MACANCLVFLAQSPLMGHNNCCIFCDNITAQESTVVDSGFDNLLLPFCFVVVLWSTGFLLSNLSTEGYLQHARNKCIGGFRGGAEGAAVPLFFLYFKNVLRFCFENRFIKCSLILSSKTLTSLCITNTPTMLYAASPEK